VLEPGNPQSLNRYTYVLNNPLRYTDPSGHYTFEEDPDEPPMLDLTLWLLGEMNQNAALAEVLGIDILNDMAASDSLSYKLGAWYMFYQLVHDKASWDFKDKIEADLGRRVRLGGRWFEWSTPGNIFYGFIGHAAGLSPTELHAGASFAQVRDVVFEGAPLGPLKPSAFDTVDDYFAIELGCQLYESYSKDRKVTAGEFKALLVEYEHLDKMALVSMPREGSAGAPRAHHPVGSFNGPSLPWPPSLFPNFQQ